LQAHGVAPSIIDEVELRPALSEHMQIARV
jgi:hypothetical protein